MNYGTDPTGIPHGTSCRSEAINKPGWLQLISHGNRPGSWRLGYPLLHRLDCRGQGQGDGRDGEGC